MENVTEGIVLIGADAKANEHLSTDGNSFSEIVKQRLDKLKNDPEVTSIKDLKLQEFTERVQVVLKTDLSKMGLTPRKVDNIFEVSEEYMANGKNEELGGMLGKVDLNTNSVLVWHHNLPMDTESTRVVSHDEIELSLFTKAKIIGHEIYHTTASSVWRSVITGENSINVELWRMGLTYQGKDGPWALEEGLARIWEDNQVDKLAREMFPEGASIYDKYTKTIKEIGYKNRVVRNIVTGKGGYAVDDPYLESKNLVNFLIEKVPNFKELAEKARMNYKVGELTVAIDDVFGVGVSNELLNTKDEDAKKTLEGLKNKLNTQFQRVGT